MKRKVLSLLLCALLIVGLAAGCANKTEKPATPKESFFELAEGVDSLKEIGFNVTLSLVLPEEYRESVDFLGDLTDLQLNLSGSSSQYFKQFACEFVATIRGTQMESTLKLTDILYDESGIYLNLRSLFNLLSIVLKTGGPYDALFSSDYLGITTEDMMAFTGMALPDASTIDKESLPKNKELSDHLLKLLNDSINEQNFKEDLGFYTLTLNASDIIGLTKSFASDMENNSGLYADALLEIDAKSPGYLASIGLDNPSRDELIAFIKEQAAVISSTATEQISEEASDFTMLFSIGKGKAEKSYDINLSITAPEKDLDIKTSISIAEVATQKITPPANYVTLDELLSFFLM